MLCLMQNHMVQAFANSGNAIKPVSFIRDLKSKNGMLGGRVSAGASSVIGEKRTKKAMKERKLRTPHVWKVPYSSADPRHGSQCRHTCSVLLKGGPLLAPRGGIARS